MNPVNIANLGVEDIVPDKMPGEKVARGVIGGTEDFATGVVNFLSVAGPAGHLPGGAARLISAGFSADMLWNAWNSIPAFRKEIKAGNVEGAVRVATGGLASAYLGQKLGRSATKGGAAVLKEAAAKAKSAITGDPLRVDPAVAATAPTAAPAVPSEVPPPAAPVTPLAASRTRVAARKAKLAPPPEAEAPAPTEVPPVASQAAGEPAPIVWNAGEAATAAAPAPAKARLPRDLTGAKPRYSEFELDFASDTDRAAYISAQKIPSKRDADYVLFAMRQTGLSEAEVRAHGVSVRSSIKELARDAEPGQLLAIPELTPAAPKAAAPSITIPPKPKFENSLEGKAAKAKFEAKERADAIKAKAKAEADALKAQAKAATDDLKQRAKDQKDAERSRQDTLKAQATEAKAQEEAAAAERKAKNQGMPLEDAEREIAEAIPKLTDAQLLDYVEEQKVERAAKPGEPETPLTSTQIAVADELTARKVKLEQSMADASRRADEAAARRKKAGGQIIDVISQRTGMSPEEVVREVGDKLRATIELDEWRKREYPGGRGEFRNDPLNSKEALEAERDVADERAGRLIEGNYRVLPPDPTATRRAQPQVDEFSQEVGPTAEEMPQGAPPATAFRNPAGTYRFVSEEGGKVTFDFTNNKGNVARNVMPSAEWDRGAERGEPILPALGDVAGGGAKNSGDYPRISDETTGKYRPISGLKVRTETPNTASIDSSIDNPEVLPGIREIPLSDFPTSAGPYKATRHFAVADDIARVDRLAEQIKQSGEINPFIVVIDAEGPYILEGGHRYAALHKLGKTTLPAKVVIDRDAVPAPDLAPPPGPATTAETPLAAASARAKEAVAARKAKLTGKESERGAISLTRADVAPAVEKLKRAGKEVGKFATDVYHGAQPLGSVLKREGNVGKGLMRTIETATDMGEVKGAGRIADMKEAGLDTLSREEQFNLHDALQGRAAPMNTKVEDVFDAARVVLEDTGLEMERRGITAQEKVTIPPGGPVPPGYKLNSRQKLSLIAAERANRPVTLSLERLAKARHDYYPQVMASVDALKSGHVRTDIAANIERMGLRPDRAQAEAFIDRWVQFLESGKRDDVLIKHLVDTGQVSTKPEALAALMSMRERALGRQKMGSMEYARQVNLPFYDPIPGRVLPNWVLKGSVFLERAGQLGQKGEVVKKAVYDIRKAGGDYVAVRDAAARILGAVREPDTGTNQALRAVRTWQGFKLALSAIPNAIQPFNVLLKSDAATLLAGVRGSMTKEGRAFGERSGAVLENVIQEALKNAGAEGEALSKFLKWNAFIPVEKNNRIISANAGRFYAQRLLNQLKLDPASKKARYRMEELGLRPDEILHRGSLSLGDQFMAAKKMSDITQFRSRPQDLPGVFSTSWGKVVFQFKNYSYQQGRIVFDSVVGEMRRGEYGEATKNLLVLATVFPLAGRAVSELRNAITGRKEDREAWDAYWGSVTQAGAAGLVGDLMQSGAWGTAAAALGGPTLADAADLINLVGKKDVGRSAAKLAFRRIPMIGPIFVNRVFPPKAKSSDSKMRKTY